MVQIDNKKMWESLMVYLKTYHHNEIPYVLSEALKEQGLMVNDKCEIVNIEPEPFIKKEHWYMCIKTSHAPYGDDFIGGKVYYAFNDYEMRGEFGNVDIAEDNPELFFRPATPEEILTAKYGITGIGSKKAEGELGEMISQRTTSAEAKEALLEDSSRYNKHCETCSVKTNLCNPNACEIIKCVKSAKPTIASTLKEESELTDFEKCFQGMCHEENQKFAKACCVSLMALARKQIVSEIDLYAMEKDFIDNNEESKTHFASYFYKMGIEDTLKAIKKGE